MEQYELLQKLVNCLESLGIPYFITGSIASMAYGEPRLTNDIDAIVDLKKEQIPNLKQCFPDSEFYLDEAGISEAINHSGQFNIIHPASGLKIDIIIRKQDAFDDSRFSRIKNTHGERYSGNFSSPEDIIIKKMDFYHQGGSEKHLRDITGILKISGDVLDYDYINLWVDEMNLRKIWEIVRKHK